MIVVPVMIPEIVFHFDTEMANMDTFCVDSYQNQFSSSQELQNVMDLTDKPDVPTILSMTSNQHIVSE